MSNGLSRSGKFTLLALFFSWGHVSVMLDMAIPSIKSAFSLSYRDAMLVQSAFFLAYLFLSIPAGMLIGKLGFRLGAVIGLALMGAGCGLFSLSSYTAHFTLMLISVFGIASGICFLQVSANPLAAAMGGSRSPASNLTYAQAFNALGTAFGPVVASATFLSVVHATQTTSLSAVGDLFVGIALFLVLLGLLAMRSLDVAPGQTATANAGSHSLDRYAKWRLAGGSLAIFAHVGAVSSIASVLVNFLESEHSLGIARHHAAQLVTLYWGGALLGRFVGAYWLTRIAAGRALLIVGLIAALLCLIGVAATGTVAAIAVLAGGLFNAIQFPTIFSLASSDLAPDARAKAAGWLVFGIVGGGIVPLIFGAMADATSLPAALIVPAVCYLYIAIFGLTFGTRPEKPA